jgi:sporulation protein YlmC with PRC-barrel domain
MARKDPIDQDETARLISSSKVEGTEVYNTEGEHIGEIKDIMIDKYSGNVAYAIMSFGGWLGIGEKYHPLPWSVLDYQQSQEGYVVDLDRDRLEKAPSYSQHELSAAGHPWRERVRLYYGATPFGS